MIHLTEQVKLAELDTQQKRVQQYERSRALYVLVPIFIRNV